VADLVTPRTFERARIVASARRNLAEIESIFEDAAHWNRARPDAPVDPDPDGLLAKVADGYRQFLATDTGVGPLPPIVDRATMDLLHDAAPAGTAKEED
jgi:hypothetical protein